MVFGGLAFRDKVVVGVSCILRGTLGGGLDLFGGGQQTPGGREPSCQLAGLFVFFRQALFDPTGLLHMSGKLRGYGFTRSNRLRQPLEQAGRPIALLVKLAGVRLRLRTQRPGVLQESIDFPDGLGNSLFHVFGCSCRIFDLVSTGGAGAVQILNQALRDLVLGPKPGEFFVRMRDRPLNSLVQLPTCAVDLGELFPNLGTFRRLGHESCALFQGGRDRLLSRRRRNAGLLDSLMRRRVCLR